MKRAIVTGANGFIGKHLVNYLLEQNVEVWAFVRKKENKDIDGKLHYVECSMNEYRDFSIKIGGVDALFHLAWNGGIDTQSFGNFNIQFENVGYSGEALLLAKRIGCKKFILVSSMCAIEAVTCFIHEKADGRANQIYGSAKCAAEMLCKSLAEKHGINMNVCYLPSIFGEGNKSKFIFNILLRNLLEGKDTSLVKGEYLADWLYVKECTKGIYAVAEKGGAMKSYFVGHRKLKLFKEWVEETRNIINPLARLNFGAYGADPERDYSLVDLDALYRDTGFEAKEDYRKSVLDTVKWIKQLDWE